MARKRIEDIITSPRKKALSSQFRVGFSSARSSKSASQEEDAPRGSFSASSSFSLPSWGLFSKISLWFRHPILWSATLLFGVLLVLSLLWIFEKATVKVVPAERTMELSDTFTAFSSGGVGASPVREALATGLSFQVMQSHGTETKTVKATGVEHVDRKASGTIVVYNNYSSASQRLITNTRFETPDGFIYRIHESVVVPGQKTFQGKKTPGSLEVIVYADEPGEKYSIGLTDFTIPGFKGLPQYKGFYARSKTPMTGGFSGIVKTISKEELEKLKDELRTSVTRKLLEDAETQKPERFVLFNKAVFIDFSVANAEQKDVNENTVSVIGTGNLSGIMFDKEELEQQIGRKLIPTLGSDERVRIANLLELDFGFSNLNGENAKALNIAASPEVRFTLNGKAHIVWVFDEEKLKMELMGKPKKNLSSILTGFPSIVKAKAVLRPFWKRSFPEDIRDIHIELANEI